MLSRSSVAHSAPLVPAPRRVKSWRRAGTAAAWSKRSAKPPNRPNVTKPPSSRKASSFTRLSRATASTTPSCRSVASTERTPNSTVNTASAPAVNSAGPVAPRGWLPPVRIINELAIALICSEM